MTYRRNITHAEEKMVHLSFPKPRHLTTLQRYSASGSSDSSRIAPKIFLFSWNQPYLAEIANNLPDPHQETVRTCLFSPESVATIQVQSHPRIHSQPFDLGKSIETQHPGFARVHALAVGFQEIDSFARRNFAADEDEGRFFGAFEFQEKIFFRAALFVPPPLSSRLQPLAVRLRLAKERGRNATDVLKKFGPFPSTAYSCMRSAHGGFLERG
ncbi:hypothetical protein ACLOJK_001857 [Asimina triloba]